MATNHNNKGKGSGLRILWIPGRKRHNRKGQYDSTNKRVDYSSQQKRNQQWSLGGSKTHEKLANGNLSETTDISPACTSIAASCAAGAGILHKTDEAQSNDITELETKLANGNNYAKEQDEQKDSIIPDKKIQNQKKKDEKIVNYMYYSLMCCECSIS